MVTDSLREALAAEVRARLAVSRIQVAHVAKEIGVSPPTVSRKIAGLLAIQVDELATIARMLHMSTAELIQAAEDRRTS